MSILHYYFVDYILTIDSTIFIYAGNSMKQKISFLLLSIILLLVFNSCNDKNNITGPSVTQSILLNGQINNWKLGNKHLLRFGVRASGDARYHYYHSIDSCSISSSGAFSFLPLPLPDSMTFMEKWIHHASVYYPGTITISDTSVQLSDQVSFIVYSDSSKTNIGTLIRENFIDPWQEKLGYYCTNFVYATGDLDISGTYFSYPDSVFCNLHYIKGWNTETMKIISINGNSKNYEMTTAEPDGAKWFFMYGNYYIDN
jgi:hypothetical protein